MLPGRGGLEILASVRRAVPGLPVIVLTARGEIEDRVAGLEAGAVDYLVKPFSMAELVARVRAQLRVIAQASSSSLAADGIEVDLLTRKVRRDGRPVLLSTTEFELLVFLMRHHGQVVSREQILSSVWGYEHDPATNVVDVYVGYLRRKLGDRRGPRADLHGACRRLSPRRRGLIAVSSGRRALGPVSLRWRLAGWVAVVTLACTALAFLAVYRGTGSELRHQIDQELSGDARALLASLPLTRVHTPKELAETATPLRPRPAVRASSTLLFAQIPGAGHGDQPPRAVLATCRPTTARRRGQQAQENELSAHLLRAPEGYTHAGAHGRRKPAAAEGSSPRQRRRRAGDDRSRRAPRVRGAGPAWRRQRLHPGRHPRARGSAAGLLPDRHPRLSPAAPDGGRRGTRRRRRPAPAHRRPRRSERRGEGARGRLQPHARPSHRRVRRTARVRGRRLARAAHAADRDPGAARSARGPARASARGGAPRRAPRAGRDRAHQPPRR